MKKYTKEEEKFNAISHSIGILIGCAVSTLFLATVMQRGDSWAIFSVILYIFGMLASYIFSTSYHACSPDKALKMKLRKFDHAAIYWHIAGSYSPITLIALRDSGYWGWGLFFFVWLCAIVGTIISLRKLKPHNRIETVCFVLMGLLVLVAFKPLLDAVSFSVVGWLIAEGVCYITGAVLYSFHKVKHMHSVFHIFVLLGTICHMVAVWKIINV
ncbi:MAG: hemolysin III family protein [Bacteroidaceae bacterium]|nr:hemolysin III family protein [Bacteroidaceae bacterium]